MVNTLLMATSIGKAKGHKLLGNQCAKGRAAKLLRIFEFVKAYFTEQLPRYYEQTKLDFDKHNQQYEPISYVQLPHAVHDRYLIVDDDVWLLGTSVKDMGRSLCTIIKVGFTPETVMTMIK